LQTGYVKDSRINKEVNHVRRLPTSDHEENMKIHHIPNTEVFGYCHDCHNRAHLEVTFAHRPSIRLCDRCAGFLVTDVSAVIKKRNGKNGKNHNKTKTPAGG
jgi:hypothetical protein